MNSASPTSRVPVEFLRFTVAGTIGFAVDAGLLLALTSMFGWPPLLARLASFSVALATTWLINRAWTFKASPKSARGMGAEFAGYGAVQLTGGAANYGVYAIVVALTGDTPVQLLAATAAGSIAGMGINYFGARRFVFGKTSRSD
jgi:putative flippase GtrA